MFQLFIVMTKSWLQMIIISFKKTYYIFKYLIFWKYVRIYILFDCDSFYERFCWFSVINRYSFCLQKYSHFSNHFSFEPLLIFLVFLSALNFLEKNRKGRENNRKGIFQFILFFLMFSALLALWLYYWSQQKCLSFWG